MIGSLSVRPLLAAALISFVAYSLPSHADDSTPPPSVPTGQDVTADTQTGDGLGPIPDDPEQARAWAKKFLASLTERTGTIDLGDNLASIKTGKKYYYLAPSDARKVLVDAWGNPPQSGGLGMLFPAGTTPLSGDTWGVEISYEEMGHVKDDDAGKLDYDDLLSEMKKDTKEESEARVKAGYQPITLIGWAEKPYYDAKAKKLYWAKEYQIGNETTHTLNYNVRILGRKGVLVMNFIAGMDQLPEIRNQINDVLATTDFEPGNLFSDFNPSVDKVAAVGIGGLIAGKILAKAGLFGLILLGLKKIGLVLLALKKVVIVAVVAVIGFFKKMFGKGKADDVGTDEALALETAGEAGEEAASAEPREGGKRA